jgi:glyceraldehyde 3-phosphate dehydrogenase
MDIGGSLGINGLGRIGKLTLWTEVAAKRFKRIVVNTGREVGCSLDDLVHYIEHDSTYGGLGRFLHGFSGPDTIVKIRDRDASRLVIDGTEVQLLTTQRNPKDINWRAQEVRIVIDTTGAFKDPSQTPDTDRGSLQGHLEAGAQTVLLSAPFKLKDKQGRFPDDSVMLIYGINHEAYDPSRHCLVSAASCTTTALAHMIKPLLEHELTHNMLTASMSTIHAATNSQSVLDVVPKSGAKDMRKTRSALNNMILTSTGAARALERVIPEISSIGFLADSVRVPIPTASLIILNCTFQSKLDDFGNSLINRDAINGIFKDYAAIPRSGVRYTDSQNVSTDMIGGAAPVAIEGVETHARTGFTRVNLRELGLPTALDPSLEEVEVPVTHLKLFGWYDNELGSYTRRMSELCHHIADRIG